MANDSEGPWVLPCGHEVLDPNQMHYCRYIALQTLLNLQKPNAGVAAERPLAHPDEYQFIVVHQMCELAFAEVIYELKRVIHAIGSDQFDEARKLVQRIMVWMELVRQIAAVFRTMHPDQFAAFRDLLAPASGAESYQYRIIELMSGVKENAPYAHDRGKSYSYRAWLDRAPGPGPKVPKTRWWTNEMAQVATEPSLASAFDAALGRFGITIPELYARVAYPELRALADALYRYEQTFVAFRSTHENGSSVERARPHMGHLEVVQQQIGKQEGTGHTSGVPYLRSVAKTARFFPELWEFKEARQEMRETPRSW